MKDQRYFLVDDDEIVVPCRLTKDAKPYGMRVYMALGRIPLAVVRELPHSPAPPSWHLDRLAVMAFRACGSNVNFKLFTCERKGERYTVNRIRVWFSGRPQRPYVSLTKAEPSSWGEVNRIIRCEADE